MDFTFDEQQVALQDAVRGFCADRFPLDRLAEREGRPLDRAAWRGLGDLGVLGVLAPEAVGGSGLGAIEAAIALEELGAHLVPGPLVWSVVTADLVAGAATGERVVGGVEVPVPAGEPILVEHAADLDVLVVLAPDGVHLCERAALLAPEPVAPLDVLTPIGRWPALPEGERLADAEGAARLRDTATALTAAVLVGVAAAGLETARSYALERHQFGVPIGSFQAIKHLLADALSATEVARAALHGAAVTCDEDGSATDTWMAVASARLLASRAAQSATRACIQVHGGMGFTWELDAHLLLKRALVLDTHFETPDGCRDRISEML